MLPTLLTSVGIVTSVVTRRPRHGEVGHTSSKQDRPGANCPLEDRTVKLCRILSEWMSGRTRRLKELALPMLDLFHQW